jgi:hypothetical protein
MKPMHDDTRKSVDWRNDLLFSHPRLLKASHLMLCSAAASLPHILYDVVADNGDHTAL